MTRNYEKLGWTDRNLISANFNFNYLFHENLFGNSRSQVRSSALPVHTGTHAPLHNSPAEWPGPSPNPVVCLEHIHGRMLFLPLSSWLPTEEEWSSPSCVLPGDWSVYAMPIRHGSVSEDWMVWIGRGECSLGTHIPSPMWGWEFWGGNLGSLIWLIYVANL